MSTTDHHAGDTKDTQGRCEAVDPGTGRRCANSASKNGLCAVCRHVVTVVRAHEVAFDPTENPTPFSELDTIRGGDDA